MERLPDELERRVVRSLHLYVDPVVTECRREMAVNPTGHDDTFDNDTLGTDNVVYADFNKQEPPEVAA